MRNSKRGLKALGLALLSALSMMAFTAASAQAQTLPGASLQGTFTINGKNVLLANLDGTGGLGSLLVPARDLKLECHQAHIKAAQLHNASDALGEVLFLKCLSFSLSSGEHLPCVLTTLGTITANTLALPILHGSPTEHTFVLFEPVDGKTTFTTVSYKAGTECPLPLNNPVTGSIAAKTDELEAVNQLLLFSPEIQLLTGDVLRYGNAPSYIHADATVFLSGEHLNDTLGIH